MYLCPYIYYSFHSLLTDCSQVIGSYNGGKDAVVIMHLMRAAHASYHKNFTGDPPTKPKVVYFDSKDEFPEVLSLLHQTIDAYDLQMIAFDQSYSFSEGLETIVTAKKPSQMAFVLGTRKDDPNAGSQGLFAPSSDWMPPFMRVNPILHWSYGQVWHFLRLFQLPYCSLYDEGYTSLGTVKNTRPCPSLARPQGGFWPAYMLRDFDQERAGRISKPKKKKILKPSPSQIKLEDMAGDNEPVTKNFYTEDVETADSSSKTRQKTVGLIIIGDEILKGSCMDTNTHSAAKSMRDHNVPLTRVAVVSDDQNAIVNEIHRMYRNVDIIVTSGGVGPTHDDVTMKSVSKALSSPLMIHKEMSSFLLKKMNKDKAEADKDLQLSEAQIKMATLPQNSKLLYLAGKDEWPILQCRHIYILPGVPQFFASKIALVAAYISEELEQSETYKVVLSVDEQSIVNVLNKVVLRHPYVSFGSYPFVGNPEYQTVVTLDWKDISAHDTTRAISFQHSQSMNVPSNIDISVAPGKNGLTSARSMSEDTSFSKAEMDLHVKLALDELLQELPQGSILRVDNDDDLDKILI